MSKPPIQVTYSLEEILLRIERNLGDFRQETNQKLEKIDERLTNLEVKQTKLEAELKGDIKALEEKTSNLSKTLEEKTSNLSTDIKEIKGSQSAQIWTLIGVLSTTVVGAVIRFIIIAIPGKP